jgi:SAM-dependent methyltransferase
VKLGASQQNWEYLAQKDPLWAILSDPTKKDGRWQLDEFFALGQHEIDGTLGYLARRGLEPVDFETALDFGCGVGRLSRALAGRFRRVFGVDAAPTMLAQASRLNQHIDNLELVLNQAPQLRGFADGSISFAYSSLVLQHIPHPASLGYLRELLRVLKPGGVLVFQTPTRDRTPLPMRAARALARATVRRLRLPRLDGMYIDMNTIPVRAIEGAVADAGADLVDRFNIRQRAIDGAGRLMALPAPPRWERLVEERFTARKRRGTRR